MSVVRPHEAFGVDYGAPAVRPTRAVDADLFDSLEEAIAFVGERGGGVVRTDAWDSLWAKSFDLPPGVRLAPLSAKPQDPGGGDAQERAGP